jgi:hypothetical protein
MPTPPPPPPLFSPQQARPATHRKAEKERQVSDGGGGRGWAWSHKKAWLSMNHTILPAYTCLPVRRQQGSGKQNRFWTADSAPARPQLIPPEKRRENPRLPRSSYGKAGQSSRCAGGGRAAGQRRGGRSRWVPPPRSPGRRRARQWCAWPWREAHARAVQLKQLETIYIVPRSQLFIELHNCL